MANDRLSVSILMRLVDDVSRPMQRVRNAIVESMREATSALEHYREKAKEAFEQGMHMKEAGEAFSKVAEKIHEFSEVPIEKAMDLQVAITRLGVGAHSNAAEFQKLTSEAINLASGTEYSASEVAQAARTFKRGGLTTTDALGQMSAVMRFATAHVMSLGEATGRVSALMKGFKLPADQAAHATDVLTAAAKVAGVPVADFSDQLAHLAPTARGMGVSMESAASTLALLGQAGLTAEQGAGALNAMMTRLAGSGRSTKLVQGVLKYIGVEARDAQGNLKDLPDLLGEIQKHTAGMGNLMRQRIFTVLFGRQAAASINAMFSAMKPGEVDKLRESLREVEGATEQMSGRMEETAEAAKKKFGNSIEVLQATLGMRLLPSLTSFYDKMTQIVAGITRWSEAHPRLATVIMRTIQIVGALATAISGLISVMAAWKAVQGVLFLATGYKTFASIIMSAVIPALGGMASGFTAVVGAIGTTTLALAPYVAAVGAVVLAFKELAKYWDDMNISEIWKGIKENPADLLGLFDPTALLEDVGVLGDNSPARKTVQTLPDAELVPLVPDQSSQVAGKIDINVNQEGRVTSVSAASESDIDLDVGGGLAWAMP